MFIIEETNEQCIYAVSLYKNGLPIAVVLDDFIVCKNAQPAFSKAAGCEIWVLLLEKAWAKIHGSFHRIIGGMSHLTMRDLTGAPGYEYEIKKTPELFDIILDAD